MNLEDLSGSTALVTGASAGIGAAYARGLARRRCDVVLVARRRERLEQMAAELTQSYGVRATVVAVDLSREHSAAQVREQTDAAGLKIDVLVNNAGFGSYGPYEKVEPELDHGQAMLNVVNLVDLTHAYLPDMVERGSGAILNISSIAALQPIPYMAVYGASKAFILAFSEALWEENRSRGIGVLAVCPGATDTEFFEVIGNEEETLFGKKVSPDVVVDLSLKALAKGRGSIIIGGRNRFTALAPRVLPRAVVVRISGRVTRPRTQAAVLAAA